MLPSAGCATPAKSELGLPLFKTGKHINPLYRLWGTYAGKGAS